MNRHPPVIMTHYFRNDKSFVVFFCHTATTLKANSICPNIWMTGERVRGTKKFSYPAAWKKEGNFRSEILWSRGIIFVPRFYGHAAVSFSFGDFMVKRYYLPSSEFFFLCQVLLKKGSVWMFKPSGSPAARLHWMVFLGLTKFLTNFLTVFHGLVGAFGKLSSRT